MCSSVDTESVDTERPSSNARESSYTTESRRSSNARLATERYSRNQGNGKGERRSWMGPTRVDYADIWEVLHMQVPSGELVFDSKKLLGRGASSNVYWTELHGVECAIKVLSSTSSLRAARRRSSSWLRSTS